MAAYIFVVIKFPHRARRSETDEDSRHQGSLRRHRQSAELHQRWLDETGGSVDEYGYSVECVEDSDLVIEEFDGAENFDDA